MLDRFEAWWGALTVTLITAALVILDVSDGAVSRYWSEHAFTSSVLSGLLVLSLTVLIVNRVARLRQVRGQSRAVAAQAAIIVVQASRTADAIARAPSSEDRDEASGELRTYAQMLFTSAPVLLDAKASRTFLETAQRVAAQLFRILTDSQHAGDHKPQLDAAVSELRTAAAPLLSVLDRDQREAVSPEQA